MASAAREAIVAVIVRPETATVTPVLPAMLASLVSVVAASSTAGAVQPSGIVTVTAPSVTTSEAV